MESHTERVKRMLVGESLHTLDEKSRIIIPARFREDLGCHVVLTKGLDGCLFIYPQTGWKVLVDRLQTLPLTNAKARSFTRLFLAGAHEIELDRQFRLTIPPNLREFAGIAKDVVAIGVSSRVEIWGQSQWSQYQADAQPEFEAIAETMAELGW